MPWLVDSGWGRFWLVKLVKIKDLSAFYPRGFFVIFVSSFAFLCWEMIQDVVSLFLRIIGGLDARINCSLKSQISRFLSFSLPWIRSSSLCCATRSVSPTSVKILGTADSKFNIWKQDQDDQLQEKARI